MAELARVLCLHGYGMRGHFWDVFVREARDRGIDCIVPDMATEELNPALRQLDTVLEGLEPTTSLVLGHSLGGIVAALAVAGIPRPSQIPLVIVSSPWGQNTQRLRGVQKFLLRWGLIPEGCLRARFFGPGITRKLQKSLFDRAVPESALLKELIRTDPWFHTELLDRESLRRGLCIAGDADRIVQPSRTRAFADALGLDYRLLESGRGVGHNDVAVDPEVCRKLLDLIISWHGADATP